MNNLIIEQPELVIEEDYDGYFEGLVKGMIENKNGKFKHKKIVVTSGPYRPYTMGYESKDDTINIDFYSAIRNGFGSLSNDDIDQMTELL